jgi:hypothetical protein
VSDLNIGVHSRGPRSSVVGVFGSLEFMGRRLKSISGIIGTSTAFREDFFLVSQHDSGDG